MENEKIPAPPKEGIVYGEVAYWLLIIGLLITIIGSVFYLTSSQAYVDKATLLDRLWQGCDCQTIWQAASGSSQPPAWYSSFGRLSQGDMVATLGIAIACLAAVFGMWGATFQLVRGKGRFYVVFAFIIAAVLTLSALGIVNLEA